MRQLLIPVAIFLAACGGAVTTVDNAADASQGAQRGKQASSGSTAIARSATWIVGAWATSAPECRGAGGITFESGGTFFADGDAGTWTLSGAALTMVTRSTYELGGQTTQLRNPVTRRMQVRAQGPNRMTIDGAAVVRCP